MLIINEERLLERIHTLGAVGLDADGRRTRLAASDEDKAGRDLVSRWMRETGLTVVTDYIGNLFGIWTPEGCADAAPLMLGSHIDTVINAGQFDGCYGVLAALEVVETLKASGFVPARPIAIGAFTNEEGVRYAPDMMGSLVYAGGYPLEKALASVGTDGTVLGEELRRIGYAGTVEPGFLKPCAFVELHIEQGPILEDAGNDIGVVDCVLGMFNYRLKFYGQTTHAGTFPMPKRRDAFLAASQALCYLHEEIDKLGYSDLVYTTGEVVCHPCVHTCVPDFFDFSFDARHENPEVLKKVLAIVKSCADKTWAGCTCEVVKAWNRDTVYWDKKLVEYVKESAEECGIKHQYIHSGAGHDAQFAAYMLPTTMIFVQSKDGLSHCEPEFSSVKHCTEGATVMLNAVLKADND